MERGRFAEPGRPPRQCPSPSHETQPSKKQSRAAPVSRLGKSTRSSLSSPRLSQPMRVRTLFHYGQSPRRLPLQKHGPAHRAHTPDPAAAVVAVHLFAHELRLPVKRPFDRWKECPDTHCPSVLLPLLHETLWGYAWFPQVPVSPTNQYSPFSKARPAGSGRQFRLEAELPHRRSPIWPPSRATRLLYCAAGEPLRPGVGPPPLSVG